MSETRVELPLVEGRTCGSCTVCCVTPAIDEKLMQKLPGVPCRHLGSDHRCAIYESRYPACRAFYCGFRQFSWIPAAMRPDQCGVLVVTRMLHAAGEARLAAIFVVLQEDALASDGLVPSVIAAVRQELRVVLSVPGPPGYVATRTDLSDELLMPVMMRDKREILEILRETYARAKTIARTPVVFGDAAGPAS